MHSVSCSSSSDIYCQSPLRALLMLITTSNSCPPSSSACRASASLMVVVCPPCGKPMVVLAFTVVRASNSAQRARLVGQDANACNVITNRQRTTFLKFPRGQRWVEQRVIDHFGNCLVIKRIIHLSSPGSD